MRTLVIALLLALPALAGCIQPPGGAAEAATVPADARDVDSTSEMSARETVEESVGACVDRNEPYCATKRVVVAGDLTLDSLPITLSTVNGHVEVAAGSDTRWSLEATLRAHGDTEAAAKRALRNLAFSWSHRSGDAHGLDAKARLLTNSARDGESASLRVVVPANLLVELNAGTTNGGITVEGLRTDGLSAKTTNGGITLRATVTNVLADTTNGRIDAELTPTRSGRLMLDTTNGGIELRLPESEARGYDVHADTTNGRATIELRDGTVSGTEPDEKRFRTTGYDSRAIRTTVSADTTNGSIAVTPT